jgi:hypothetical protein
MVAHHPQIQASKSHSIPFFPPLPLYPIHTTMSGSAMESVRALNKYAPIITDLLCMAGVVDASRLVLRVSPPCAICRLSVVERRGSANPRAYEMRGRDVLIPPFPTRSDGSPWSRTSPRHLRTTTSPSNQHRLRRPRRHRDGDAVSSVARRRTSSVSWPSSSVSRGS